MYTPPLTTVSIIIPVYSGSRFLQRLLLNISNVRNEVRKKNITIADVICVLDDPVDDSKQVLRNLINDYPFLRIVELASNVGQHQATAVGILASSSDWIVTLDEDLQHDPALIPLLLLNATDSSADLVYCKNLEGTHRSKRYRDFSSSLSKVIISFLTGQSFSGVSSYRLIRSEIAKSAAIAMVPEIYLDSLLFHVTSTRRRLVYKCSFYDQRPNESSYSFKMLVKHFARFLTSSEIRITRIILFFFLCSAFAVSIFGGLTLYGFYDGVLQSQPGWTSIMLINILNIIVSSTSFLILLKFLSLISLRSLRLSPFIVVDRESDQLISKALKY